MVEKVLTEEGTVSTGQVEPVDKKVPLFEYEVPIYRKRPREWDANKPTR